jgi:hypothetical protein
VAAIDYADCPHDEIDISRVVVTLKTVGDVVARKHTVVFIPTTLGNAGLGTVFHVLVTAGHEPRRRDANELRIAVRHGNQSLKAGPSLRKLTFKANRRRRLAGSHHDDDRGSQDHGDPAYGHEKASHQPVRVALHGSIAPLKDCHCVNPCAATR